MNDNKDLLFNILKDDVRTIDLEKLLVEKKQFLLDQCKPFYTQKYIQRLQDAVDAGIRDELWNIDDIPQPTWPKGNVRQQRYWYNSKKQEIYNITNTLQHLKRMAWRDYEELEWDHTISIDIVVRKTKNEEQD